jgi:hypothetical protein
MTRVSFTAANAVGAATRLVALLAALAPTGTVNADPIAWEQWQHQAGIVDLTGPRSDGSLVAVAAGRLYIVSRDGAIAPFAAGADGFSGSVDGEPYAVVAPAPTDPPAECAFITDDVFALDLTSPPGVTRVDTAGHASRFAALPSVDTLGGIAFDTTGQFGRRLLVTGSKSNRTSVFAIDCQGKSTTITDSAPPVEGGLAVAPFGFGPFGGMLIAPDENSGQVWAIASDGKATLVIKPDLPTGGDTGVESIGFVPPAFSSGGSAYLADRATSNNPFPGTDSLLRLSAPLLKAAGVQDGDLLVATEGGGMTVAIHCEATCKSVLVASGPSGGHIEGHIAFAADQPAQTITP